MDRDGQLTFSDDPLLPGINEAYQLIEEGNFIEAAKIIDGLMNQSTDYPGLIEGYRTAKFWNNRKDEIDNSIQGKKKADYFMRQWNEFNKYAIEKNMTDSAAYRAARKYVFQNASMHYKIAFQNQESTADNFDLLVNLGICFLTIGEYNNTIETLEYARSSYKSDAKLLSILAEAYYHTNEIPRSLLYFREAFLINPAEIELDLLKSKPIQELIEIVQSEKPGCTDVREWIPILGSTEDIFYVKRPLNSQQVEAIKREIYNMEKSFQTMNRDKIAETNIIPRLINKYLWMLDYFEQQNYDFESVTDIRKRLIKLDKELFEDYFKKNDRAKR
jgi:tetratricopeptide (TPR) repeat protein